MKAFFKIFRNSEWQDFLVLSELPVVIGRENCSNTCTINSDTVSRQHLKIFFVKNEYFCCDLNSTNGTRINNDVQLEPFYPYHLVDGDIVLVADSPLKFFSPDRSPDSFRIFIFDHDLNLILETKFLNETSINSEIVPNVDVTFKNDSFYLRTKGTPRVILASSSEILSDFYFKISNPGSVRIDNFIFSLSGARKTQQESSETLLPAILGNSNSERPASLKSDRGTIVIQHVYDNPWSKKHSKSDYMPKFLTESRDLLNLENILLGIIVITFALTLVLIVWYLTE
ncbi:MAG: FHA domain-containing protein [Deltaproteobacteria bacterium]|nr:FHA domain-containing protein [Deltaproteobacteria bacterium]